MYTICTAGSAAARRLEFERIVNERGCLRRAEGCDNCIELLRVKSGKKKQDTQLVKVLNIRIYIYTIHACVANPANALQLVEPYMPKFC